MKNDKVLLYDRKINSNQLVHIHLLCFVCKNNLNLSGLITNGINSLTDLSLMVGVFFSEKNMLITKHTFFLIKFSTTIRIKSSLISKIQERIYNTSYKVCFNILFIHRIWIVIAICRPWSFVCVVIYLK